MSDVKVLKFIYQEGRNWRWYLIDADTDRVYAQGTNKTFKTAEKKVQHEWLVLMSEFEMTEVTT